MCPHAYTRIHTHTHTTHAYDLSFFSSFPSSTCRSVFSNYSWRLLDWSADRWVVDPCSGPYRPPPGSDHCPRIRSSCRILCPLAARTPPVKRRKSIIRVTSRERRDRYAARSPLPRGAVVQSGGSWVGNRKWCPKNADEFPRLRYRHVGAIKGSKDGTFPPIYARRNWNVGWVNSIESAIMSWEVYHVLANSSWLFS